MGTKMKLVKVRVADDLWDQAWTAYSKSRLDKWFGPIRVDVKWGKQPESPLEVVMYFHSPNIFDVFGEDFYTFEKSQEIWKKTQDRWKKVEQYANSAFAYAKQLRQKLRGKTTQDLVDGNI